MNHALARAGYSLLLRLLTPAYLARLWWRGAREPLYRSAWHERLGYFRGVALPGRLWVHAVSLGETRACLLYTSPSPRDRTRSRMPSSA